MEDEGMELDEYRAQLIRPYVEQLSSADPEDRRSAALVLCIQGRLGQEAAAALTNALYDPIAEVRLWVLKAMQSLWVVTSETVPRLLNLLSDSEFEVRGEAEKCTRRLGRCDVPALLRGLIQENEDCRRIVASCLLDMDCGVIARDDGLMLIKALRDSTPLVRSAAARSCGQVEGEVPASIVAELTKALGDKSRMVRQAVGTALCILGTDNAVVVTALDEMAKHGDVSRRRRAVVLLGRIGARSADAVPTLTSALSDQAVRLREAAAVALGRIGGQALPATDKLIEMLDDREPSVRRAAAFALGGIGNGSVGAAPKLRVVARDENELVARAAVWASGRLGDIGIPTLIEALENSTLPVQRVAVNALRRLGKDAHQAEASLTRALLHPDWVIRARSAEALGRIGPAAAPSVAALTRVLETDRGSVCLRAAEALGRIGSAAMVALPCLCQLVDTSQRELRQTASNAIESITAELASQSVFPEDETMMEWFEQLDFGKWLKRLRVFWCIGRLERDSLLACGAAMGTKRLEEQLKSLQKKGQLPRLSIGESSLRETIEDLESMFNCAPFPPEAWMPDERSPDFKAKRMRGKRLEASWTPRGRRAWLYVDRYLEIKGLRPMMVM